MVVESRTYVAKPNLQLAIKHKKADLKVEPMMVDANSDMKLQSESEISEGNID